MRAAPLSLLAFTLLTSCAAFNARPPPAPPAPPPNLAPPFAGYASAHYKDPKAWLCWPGRADVCARNLDATELRPDGTRVEVRETRAANADKIDCFYVYPTVDLRMLAGNHTDFTDLEDIERVAFVQAARFSSVCRVFVPLYRQITFGTYLQSEEVKRPYTAVAESDVVDAFLHYMGQANGGRKIVLIGHSQGAEMIVRLLQRFFDRDPVMRERLLLAMPIGWPMEVERGKTTGGTFAELPMCTKKGEIGCVIGYRTHVAGTDPAPKHAMPKPGHESICVHPGELLRGSAGPLGRAFLPSRANVLTHMRGLDDVTTPFVLLREFYSASCVEGTGGYRYLAVSDAPPPGDRRQSPVDFADPWLHGILGLHVYDVQLGLGDLVDLVRERASP